MKVNTRPRHKNSPRIAEKHCPGFLQWLRGRECFAARGGNCAGKMEAAHVDYAGDKGMGTKASDKFAIPLCSYHHREQHRIGWNLFDRGRLGGTGAALNGAKAYWNRWPGRPAWERKLSDG